jgi:hypothetical protein
VQLEWVDFFGFERILHCIICLWYLMINNFTTCYLIGLYCYFSVISIFIQSLFIWLYQNPISTHRDQFCTLICISTYNQFHESPLFLFPVRQKKKTTNEISFKYHPRNYYPLANEVAKGYSNATVRPSVTSLWTMFNPF